MVKSAYATSFTRTGQLDMKNRKPYRTAQQKQAARNMAYKTDKGFWKSNAPKSYH